MINVIINTRFAGIKWWRKEGDTSPIDRILSSTADAADTPHEGTVVARLLQNCYVQFQLFYLLDFLFRQDFHLSQFRLDISQSDRQLIISAFVDLFPLMEFLDFFTQNDDGSWQKTSEFQHTCLHSTETRIWVHSIKANRVGSMLATVPNHARKHTITHARTPKCTPSHITTVLPINGQSLEHEHSGARGKRVKWLEAHGIYSKQTKYPTLQTQKRQEFKLGMVDTVK